MSYDDYCVDCVAYGDDYYTDEEGNLVCRCSQCSFNDDEEDCDGAD